MMVMWDEKEINVKSLGERLYLDSGTLTPLLKKLESKGYITRTRNKDDERNLNIKLTKLGMDLKEKAKAIPQEVGKCINLSKEETLELYNILYKILGNI